ncbi:hypothetical protein H0H93_013806, partial [Arthromyces matolae]
FGDIGSTYSGTGSTTGTTTTGGSGTTSTTTSTASSATQTKYVVEPGTLDLQLALPDRLAHTPTPTILSACKPNMEVDELKLVIWSACNRSTLCINSSDTQH